MTNEYTNQNEIKQSTKSAQEKTINYKIQPLQNGTYTFNTSDIETYIRLYEKGVTRGTSRTFKGEAYGEIASNDNIISLELSGNKDYILSVGGYNDTVGKFNLTISRIIGQVFSPSPAPVPSSFSSIKRN